MTDTTFGLSEQAQDFTWLLARFAQDTAGVIDVVDIGRRVSRRAIVLAGIDRAGRGARWGRCCGRRRTRTRRRSGRARTG